MEDRWSSVASMLRWQLDRQREQVKAIRQRLPEMEAAFPLPKPTDGQPDNWGWGTLTMPQVITRSIMSDLEAAETHIEHADTALIAGELPLALHRVFSGQAAISSACAAFTGGNASRLWRHIDRRRSVLAASAAKGNRLRTVYPAALRSVWQDEWVRYKANGHSKARAAQLIATSLGLPPSSVESIRKALK